MNTLVDKTGEAHGHSVLLARMGLLLQTVLAPFGSRRMGREVVIYWDSDRRAMVKELIFLSKVGEPKNFVK